ncbi:hypothetical protein Z043_126265, partial [Scleropages formosus]
RTDRRVVTVHVFDSFVSADIVAAFLGDFADVLPRHEEDWDLLGIWTGQRHFLVRLRPDPAGMDGYRHPPAYFTLGKARGYLFYEM